MFSNSSILGFPKRNNLFLSFFSERDKVLFRLEKLEKTIFKFFLYFFKTLILTKIALYLVPEALIIHYLGANPCWNNFGISAFSGSIIQIPGLLLHSMACTLAKQGIIHAFIEVFIAVMIVVGIITLLFENKYFSQKSAIKRNFLNFGQMRGIIETHIRIKCEQKDKNSFVNLKNDTPLEVFRIPGSSWFCWIDIYDGNIYGPILWEDKSKESEDKADIVVRTE